MNKRICHTHTWQISHPTSKTYVEGSCQGSERKIQDPEKKKRKKKRKKINPMNCFPRMQIKLQ